MTYVFGDYELDTTLYELRTAGESQKLEPRVFNVLAYLIEHRAYVVTREELLDYLWPGLSISDSLLNNCIMEARKAVGDSGQGQQVIKTLHGRGYRFIAPTTEQWAQEAHHATPGLPTTPMSTMPRSQEPVARVSPASRVPWDAFQDVLAGDQTVGTVVCGTLDHGDVRTGSVAYAEIQRLRQTFFALAWDEARRSAGTCTFFGADGIVWRFTEEAHAQRAVCAARRLQQGVQASAIAINVHLPIDVTVRCGVHTGPLAVPTLSDVPWCSSMTTVETMTVAVWLHYLALPGMLLTSQATRQFLAEVAPWVDYGLVHLPGQTEPIMAYSLGGSSASDTSPEG